jgi:hypothetical protein
MYRYDISENHYLINYRIYYYCKIFFLFVGLQYMDRPRPDYEPRGSSYSNWNLASLSSEEYILDIII